MSLVDTTDGVLMLGAYGWAFMKPIRKLYYNLTITAVSVVVAVLIGGIETLGLIGDTLKLEGAFWDFIGALNDNFGLLGYVIIGVFAASWIASIADLSRQGLRQPRDQRSGLTIRRKDYHAKEAVLCAGEDGENVSPSFPVLVERGAISRRPRGCARARDECRPRATGPEGAAGTERRRRA